MAKTVKKAIVGILSGIALVGCATNDYNKINKGFNNIVNFQEATTEIVIKTGNELLSQTTISYTKNETSVSYEEVKVELSEDLSSPELMTTTTSTGSFLLDDLAIHLPVNFEIQEEYISDFVKEEEGNYSFKVLKDYLDDVFNFTQGDIDSVSGTGIDVKVVIENKMVTTYECSYTTVKNASVKITTSIE